jgi:hypothetical protein
MRPVPAAAIANGLIANARREFLIAMFGGAFAGIGATYALYTLHLGVTLTQMQLGLTIGAPLALAAFFPIQYALKKPKVPKEN